MEKWGVIYMNKVLCEGSPSSSFGAQLKQLRKQRKMTVRELSERSGVSLSYISQMENGNRGVPKPQVLKSLAAPLGVSYETIMMGAGYIPETEITQINQHHDIVDVLRSGEFSYNGSLLTEKQRNKLIQLLPIVLD